jgi:hypothetical protein
MIHSTNVLDLSPKVGITIEPSEIKADCDAVLRKLSGKNQISSIIWL